MGNEAPSPSDNEDFAHRLRLAMHQAGYETDAEIKDALREWFDVSLEAVRKWLTGNSLPRTRRIFEIASRCHVRGEWLAHGEGSPETFRGQRDHFKSYVQEVRSRNLRRWINEDPVAKGNVSTWCEHYSQKLAPGEAPFNPIHIRQYIPKGGRRHGSIGEQLARKIERAVGRPMGSLDQDQDGAPEIPNTTSALERALYAATPSQLAMIDVLLGIEPRAWLPPEAKDLLRVAARLAEKPSVDQKE